MVGTRGCVCEDGSSLVVPDERPYALSHSPRGILPVSNEEDVVGYISGFRSKTLGRIRRQATIEALKRLVEDLALDI